MAISIRSCIKSINTIQLIHHKKQNEQLPHIIAQILGLSPNYSVALI
jgi:hypothetical protein